MSNTTQTILLYSGTGNTFALMDSRGAKLQKPEEHAVMQCRKSGVDGLLVIENSDRAELRMRIFNPDGSEAEMCGNGSRCVAHWAHHEAGITSPMRIETGAGLLCAEVSGNNAKIRLMDPRRYRENLVFRLGEHEMAGYFLELGVPHTVIRTDRLDDIPLVRWGACIRHDTRFQPQGTNADFFEHRGGNRIAVRTYERGVEGETSSCGTGSAASAIVAAKILRLGSPVEVHVASGQKLWVHFRIEDGTFTEVYLEGPVTKVGEEK